MTHQPTLQLIVEIGATPVRFRTGDPRFAAILEQRYGGFITASPSTEPFDFDVQLLPEAGTVSDDDVRVTFHSGCWELRRGDFFAEWWPAERRGRLLQQLTPYGLDSALRILHTLLLAPQGGFLLHAASAVRNGRAYVFSGVSGAGKTTISRLAPRDVTLLSDEISYLRPDPPGYCAFGTPFAGELLTAGANVSAPVAAVFLLAQGTENRREPVSAVDATRALLRNILFFAEDPQLVGEVFRSACDFVARVPVFRLTFVPDHRVWELIP